MPSFDADGEAEQLYREAGFDYSEPVRPARIAEVLLGPGCVHRMPPGGVRAFGTFALVHGQPRIYVRSGPRHEVDFRIAHELAEWHLHRAQYVGGDIEDRANAIAAAVVAPRRAFRRAVAALGADDYARLAFAFRSTQSLVALRRGEVLGDPIALVTPPLVRVRGPEEFVWPEESVLRRAARGGRPGLRRTKLTDDPRRVILAAAI